MKASAFLGPLLAVAASELVLVVFLNLPAFFFHVSYFCLLLLLSVSYTMAREKRLVPLAPLLAVFVLVWFIPALHGASLNSDAFTYEYSIETILSTGRIPFGGGGPEIVQTFSLYPGLQAVGVSLFLVAAIPVFSFLSFGGSLLIAMSAFLMFIFYRRFLGSTDFGVMSLIVAGLSPGILAFAGFISHQELALVFLWLLMIASYGISNSQRGFTAVFLLASIAIVLTHHLTAFFVVILGLTYCVSWIAIRLSNSNDRLFSVSRTVLFTLIFIIWNFFLSVSQIGGWARILTSISIETSVRYTEGLLEPLGIKPTWIIFLEIVGLLTYLLVVLGGMLKTFRDPKFSELRPFALGVAAAVAPMLILGGFASGVQVRGVLFGYLFLPAFFVYGIESLLSKLRLVSRMRKRFLVILLVGLTLTPAIYYGMNPSFYDNSTPLTGDDYRLGYSQMLKAVLFVYDVGDSMRLFSVSLASDVAPPGETSISPLWMVIPSSYSSFPALIQSQCSRPFPTPILLRNSIVTVSDRGVRISSSEFQLALSKSDIVYSSGDPIVLYVIPCY